MQKIITTRVAGVSHGNRQEILARLEKQPTNVWLVREPQNLYDPNAIGVMTCDPISNQGVQIGYLPKEIAVQYAAWMDNGHRIQSALHKVVGGKPGKENRGLIISILQPWGDDYDDYDDDFYGPEPIDYGDLPY